MTDTLQFFSRSADKYPGMGTGEFVSDPDKYDDLSRIQNWRKMFSDTWEEDIMVDGLTYRTHHHAFQAAKFNSAKLNNIGYIFSKESNSELSKGSARDAFRARKVVMLDSKQMEMWDSKRGSEKDKIYRAKYTIDSDVGKALMATKDALLVNHGFRLKRVICERLMMVRAELLAF